MSIVTISQPRYLPAPNYLCRFALSDVFVLLDTVQYTPRDWENRNRIKGPNGAQWLSVPVIAGSRTQPIRDIRIDAGSGWARKHLQTLRCCYGQAPQFEALFPRLEAELIRPWTFLVDLDEALTCMLLERLDFGCRIVRASALAPQGRGQDLLLDILERVDGSVYLSGPHGRDYIDPAAFAAAGCGLVFDGYAPQPYPQRFGGFVPWLSAVDLLFNCAPDEARGVVLAGAVETAARLASIHDLEEIHA